MIRQQPEGHNTFASGGFLLLRSKSEPGGTLYNSGICELASDKRYLCVRINYQAGSFSRQSKSRYDRRLSFRKTGTYNSTNQNLLQKNTAQTYIHSCGSIAYKTIF